MSDKVNLSWQVGYQEKLESICDNFVTATVPGAVQLDWARAKNLPDYWYGDNYKLFSWMEDMYWIYRSEIDVQIDEMSSAVLIFKGIDYKYIIRIDGEELISDEGMFSQISIDISGYCNKKSLLEVIIFPVPKTLHGNGREQARESVKPAVSYGWDWHPRLVPSGIWDEAYIQIVPEAYIKSFEAGYLLSEDFKEANIRCEIDVSENCNTEIILMDSAKNPVFSCSYELVKGMNEIEFVIESPELWWVVEWGRQPIYTIIARRSKSGLSVQSIEKRIGFRRVKLLMNDGSWNSLSNAFPKTQSIAPITLELNGVKIFSKGTNWVNPEIFPGIINEKTYFDLLKLIRDANMNIIRVWGGGIVNKESFYDLCDEMGLMVWQEFPLSCNLYPDDDRYLEVLDKESVNIIKKLRTHPSLVLWCGGNELFNAWSGMTEQAFALRLLNSNCYKHDCQTPFLMTAPVYGMGHGHYNNVDSDGTEFIGTLIQSDFSAYTEFGCPGSSSAEYIKSFMSEEEFLECKPGTVWETHHAFNAWNAVDTWLRISETEYYFDGYTDTYDLVEKCSIIQEINYKSYFEEIRKHWPKCSMAINWCFNEPWPTAANNSIVNWPAIPKKAYYSVKEALRPQMTSIRATKNFWEAGKAFKAEIWILNDSPVNLQSQRINAYFEFDGSKELILTWIAKPVNSQNNLKGAKINLVIPENVISSFKIILESEENPLMNSSYTYLVKNKKDQIVQTGVLNM